MNKCMLTQHSNRQLASFFKPLSKSKQIQNGPPHWTRLQTTLKRLIIYIELACCINTVTNSVNLLKLLKETLKV